MASVIRIEKCADKDTADFRAAALQTTGFKVQIIQGDATVFEAEANWNNGQPKVSGEKVLWPSALWIVIGVQ